MNNGAQELDPTLAGPTSEHDAGNQRALVIMAHPDDVDFGAAGTVATWTREGVSVSYGIVTDGDAGGFDTAASRESIPGIRRAEQRAAAAEVGVQDVHFLGYRDGYVEPTHALRCDISRLIRRIRPHRMLIQSPERNYDRLPASHPDHLASGEAAICAIYPDARNPFAHPSLLLDEGLDAWIVPEVWLVASPTPNHFVDVTETFEAKLRAIRRHASQLANPEETAERVREWLTQAAVAAGFENGRLAEAFQVIRVDG